MNSRTKKFLSYYKPYLSLFYADMFCAIIVSAITLAIPLCIRYITKNLVDPPTDESLNQIYAMGGLMLALVAVYAICHAFVD